MMSDNPIRQRASTFFRFPLRTQGAWLVFLVSESLRSLKFAFFHALNLLNLRLKGVRYGRNLSTAGPVILDVYPGSTVRMGDDVLIVSDPKRANASVLYSRCRIKTFTPSSSVIIGNHVGLSGTSITCRSRTIRIGDHVAIGPNVIILDSDFHVPYPYGDWFSYPGFQQDRDVTIGNNCWIGLNTVILKGVHIGDHCVIAAGSVVVRDIPGNSLAAGVPAEVIRTFSPEKPPEKTD